MAGLYLLCAALLMVAGGENVCHDKLYLALFSLLLSSTLLMYLARPAADNRPASYMFCFSLSFYIYFWTVRVRPIIISKSTVAIFSGLVDDQSETGLTMFRGTLRWQPNFGFNVRLSLDATQVASGAAGRANVGLCPPSSYKTFTV